MFISIWRACPALIWRNPCSPQTMLHSFENAPPRRAFAVRIGSWGCGAGTGCSQYHDLEQIFKDLNERYFNGMMACPQLGWSRGRSKRLLGHFDPCHNAIILSRIFDSPKAPKLGLEFVVYHEMLHLRFPTEYRG